MRWPPAIGTLYAAGIVQKRVAALRCEVRENQRCKFSNGLREERHRV